MYPTAAKLIAGLLFAGLAWAASGLVAANLPEGRSAGWLAEVDAAVAFLLGWRILGARAGRGALNTLGIGLSTCVAIVVACLAVWAGTEMLERSMAGRYDGPVEALEQAVGLMVDYAAFLGFGGVLPAWAFGTIVISLAVEAIARRSA